MLRHLTRVNEIVGLREGVGGDVLVGEGHVRVLGGVDVGVVGDNIRNYIHAPVCDISPVAHEPGHPCEVPARDVQHPNHALS